MTKTKVDIISDFLGAGKTTFIRKLLTEALFGEKVMLIENKFGEIGIDGGSLKDSGIEVQEMSSGYIYYSLVGDFASLLKEILAKYTPDRIIIEPPGVGKPSDVMHAVTGAREELPVMDNSTTALVDVKKTKLYIKNFGEFFSNQAQHTKTTAPPRTDVVDQKKIDGAVQLIHEINKDTTIITTLIPDLTGEKLLETLEYPVDLKAKLFEEPAEEHEHHHHDKEHERCCRYDEEEHEHHHHHDEGHRHCCHYSEEEHEYHHHHDKEREHCYHHDEEEHGHHYHHDEGGYCCCSHDHYHYHHGRDADEVLNNVGLENVSVFTEDKLHVLLLKLTESEEFGKVVCAKSMVPSADGGAWFHFDLMPGETEVRREAAEASGEVYVTGSELKEEAIARELGA